MSSKDEKKIEAVDSASAVNADDNSKGSGRKKGSKGGDKQKTPSSNTRANKTESGSSKSTPGFADGNSVLNSYGLSVSGRKERILSAFKSEKFFHFVEQSWQQLVALKPHLTERYSYAEFRHASALQLYARIEAVKFDALGIKPAAPTRIPLPRNTRVFQPIWSILANIGTVDDDDLRVTYIPDGILPETDDLTSPSDIESLLSCTLYDWHSSWQDVLEARSQRKEYQSRDGFNAEVTTNEDPQVTKEELIKKIASARATWTLAQKREADTAQYRIVDGYLYEIPLVEREVDRDGKKVKQQVRRSSISDEDLAKGNKLWTSSAAKRNLDALFKQARDAKKKRIQPRFDAAYKVEAYTISDGTVAADPGAYGARLHWDPQLWLEYEQFVEIVTPMALFSLSMPNETVGTYAWLLPVEKREDDDANVSARMPKASIPPVTWILSLLLQSSTLPYDQRSTFYVETDRLANVLGLRQRYIRAAIKDPTAVEQYGTY
jgi:hypothetical protein